jgi:hypothetical protein
VTVNGNPRRLAAPRAGFPKAGHDQAHSAHPESSSPADYTPPAAAALEHWFRRYRDARVSAAGVCPLLHRPGYAASGCATAANARRARFHTYDIGA